MPAQTRAQGPWFLVVLGPLLGVVAARVRRQAAAPGSRANGEQDTNAPDDVINIGSGFGWFSAFAHPFGAAEKLHYMSSVLQNFKQLSQLSQCGTLQDKCVRTTVVQVLQSMVKWLQEAVTWHLQAVCARLRVGKSWTIYWLIKAWAACNGFLQKHGLLLLAFVVILVAVKLHGRQQPASGPDSWHHIHKAGAAALNSTSEGLLSIARISKESEALMDNHTKALTTAADVAAKYGMSGLSVAEGERDQIRKDQVVRVVERLHELASKSRNLGRAERTLCMDTTFEYRNMTIKLGQLHFDLQFGLASRSPNVLAQMVQQVHDSLHGILDWAVRKDGTYNQAQELGQQRQQVARGLESSSLELGLLIPTLPSLADQHRSNARSKRHEADQLQLLADGAWFTSKKHKLQKEKLEAAETASAHLEAHNQLAAAAASLRDMHNQITSGAIHHHMQILSDKHSNSFVSRERLLSVLGLAKSVSVDPAFAQYLVGFLGDMRKAIDDAASKASSICSGTEQLVAMYNLCCSCVRLHAAHTTYYCGCCHHIGDLLLKVYFCSTMLLKILVYSCATSDAHIPSCYLVALAPSVHFLLQVYCETSMVCDWDVRLYYAVADILVVLYL